MILKNVRRRKCDGYGVWFESSLAMTHGSWPSARKLSHEQKLAVSRGGPLVAEDRRGMPIAIRKFLSGQPREWEDVGALPFWEVGLRTPVVPGARATQLQWAGVVMHKLDKCQNDFGPLVRFIHNYHMKENGGYSR